MKPIKNYENLYKIDRDGNVLSIESGKFIKPERGTYWRIGLKKDGVTRRLQLHRLLAECFIDNPNNYPFVDHIDRDKYNNKLENLRWCTHSMNQHNKPKNSNGKSSKYKGVCYDNVHKVWLAFIGIDGKQYNIGRSQSEEEVARIYDKKAKELHKEFAYLNFPDE